MWISEALWSLFSDHEARPTVYRPITPGRAKTVWQAAELYYNDCMDTEELCCLHNARLLLHLQHFDWLFGRCVVVLGICSAKWWPETGGHQTRKQITSVTVYCCLWLSADLGLESFYARHSFLEGRRGTVKSI